MEDIYKKALDIICFKFEIIVKKWKNIWDDDYHYTIQGDCGFDDLINDITKEEYNLLVELGVNHEEMD